jgi:amino acid transporter
VSVDYEAAIVEAPPRSEAPERLRRSQLGLSGTVVQAAACIAPGAGAAFTTAAVASHAGVAGPFTYLISLVPALALALVIAEYARKMPTAGSFYVYLSNSFGPRTGFVTGAALFIAYLLLVPFQAMFVGTFTHGFLATYGVGIPWWLYSVFLLGMSTTFVMLGVRVASRASLVWLAFEVSVFLLLAIIVIASGGDAGLSAKPFDPSTSLDGVNGILLASVFTLFSFLGFESATTLGEEVRQPRRTIPRAVVLTTLVIGLFYVVMSYAATVGFGTSDAGLKALVGDGGPYSTLANRFVGGPMATLVSLAVIGSFVAVNIAVMTAVVRILFAMGRDRLLPEFLGGVSRRGVPGVAALTVATWSIATVVVGGTAWKAEDFESWIAYIVTFFYIAAYVLLSVGVVKYYRRHHREEFRATRHVLAPLVGLAGLGVVLWGNVHPTPPSPLNYLVWGAAATVAAAAVIAILIARRSPERVALAGRVMAGGDD